MEEITKEELQQGDRNRATNQQYKKVLTNLVQTRKDDHNKRMKHLENLVQCANIEDNLK